MNKHCGCGRPVDGGYKSCRHCRKKHREATRRRRADPQKMAEVLEYNRRSYWRLKKELFNAYGGAQCVCCGESHEEFLTIDHLKPAGSRHHKIRCGVGLFRWLKKHGYPPGYRVLCMNCNFAIGHFGYCPHHQATLRCTEFRRIRLDDAAVLSIVEQHTAGSTAISLARKHNVTRAVIDNILSGRTRSDLTGIRRFA